MVTTCGTSTRRLSDLGLSTPCWLAVADVLVGLAANCSLCLPVVGLVCPALCSHEVDQLFKRHGRNLSIRLQVTFWTAEDVDLSRDPHDWQELETGEKSFVSSVLGYLAASGAFWWRCAEAAPMSSGAAQCCVRAGSALQPARA